VIVMALACEPSLLLADEPTTVQVHVLKLLYNLQRRLGMSIIIVTHDLAVAVQLADDVAVLYAGHIVESGPVRQVIHQPARQNTQGLLAANVRPGQKEQLTAVPGAPPNLARLPSGCAFAPRCRHATEACQRAFPAEPLAGNGHAGRCLLVGA
jgi:peptide/nickel transport system ATP-binding protein